MRGGVRGGRVGKGREKEEEEEEEEVKVFLLCYARHCTDFNQLHSW